jgi:ferredoxin-NADP reductase
MILFEVPDYMDRVFYISGPRNFVVACENVLAELGVSRKNIKTDYFPGF